MVKLYFWLFILKDSLRALPRGFRFTSPWERSELVFLAPDSYRGWVR